MRGSFGGVLMFGMLTSFAGLGMFNPLSVGAGLLMGRKAYKEDMENRMLRIRNEAKMNVRRFVDDISFVVGKESRDRLRFIQRQLRDHYRGIANQTTRSLNESLQATLAAAKMEENERNTRIKELERQLNILRQIVDHATKLAPALPANPGVRAIKLEGLVAAGGAEVSSAGCVVVGGGCQDVGSRLPTRPP